MSDNEKQCLARRSMQVAIRLYPKGFRERFGEELRQTFSDLIDDLSNQGRNVLLTTVACFYDASIGAIREWMNLTVTAAFTTTFATRLSVALCLPFLVLVATALSNAPLVLPITVEGQELNGLGRLFVFGSVLLLPISFLVNLCGLVWKRDGSMALSSTLSSASLAVIQTIALLTIGSWMIAEAVNCSHGVCD